MQRLDEEINFDGLVEILAAAMVREIQNGDRAEAAPLALAPAECSE